LGVALLPPMLPRVISNFQDEDFVVWMRVAGLPTFKKLHRIINVDLEPGTYTVEIQNSACNLFLSPRALLQVLSFLFFYEQTTQRVNSAGRSTSFSRQ